MKEVAHDQNPGGLKILNLRDEPLHITGVGCGWHRNAALRKCPDLPRCRSDTIRTFSFSQNMVRSLVSRNCS